MSALFYNVIDSENPLLELDFEYLSKQILTRRSVMSDAESIHNDVSVYFEAAKTMVQAAQYIRSVTPMISTEHVDDLKFKAYKLSATIDVSDTSGIAMVDMNGCLMKWNDDTETYEKIHTEMHHSFTKNSGDTGFMFTNEIRTQNGVEFDQRVANSNHVLTYCENFPAPSVYVKRIVDIIFGI